jgi:hypothetical protein
MSESKPADDASLWLQDTVKTGVDQVLRDKSGAKPAYEPGGSRCKGGMSSIQASVRNVRTLLRMEREMTNGRHHEEEYRCRSKGRSCP